MPNSKKQNITVNVPGVTPFNMRGTVTGRLSSGLASQLSNIPKPGKASFTANLMSGMTQDELDVLAAMTGRIKAVKSMRTIQFTKGDLVTVSSFPERLFYFSGVHPFGDKFLLLEIHFEKVGKNAPVVEVERSEVKPFFLQLGDEVNIPSVGYQKVVGLHEQLLGTDRDYVVIFQDCTGVRQPTPMNNILLIEGMTFYSGEY